MESTTSSKGYLFNLIIYTHEKRRSEYFHQIARDFVKQYPCRLIFIQGIKDSETDTIEILPMSGKTANTCDQFSVNVSLSNLNLVPFVIIPKLIPDLPIYLIWGQNVTSDNEILPSFEKLATRLVFDSECAKDLGKFAKKMLDKLNTLKIDFMDVGWAEISGWRDVIAKAFASQEKINEIQECEKILIKYNKVSDDRIRHAAIQAIYLQGWIATRLGMNYQTISYDDDRIHIRYKSTKAQIEFILQPTERLSLIQGQIFEIEFNSPNQVSTILTLSEKQGKVMVHHSTNEKCELPYTLPISDMQTGLTAMKEVFYYPSSVHYRNMLNMLTQIEWKEF